MLGDITYSKIRNIIPGISVFIGHAFRANQYLFFLLNAACLAEKATNTNLMIFGLTRHGLSPTIYLTRTIKPHTYYLLTCSPREYS